MPKMWFGRRRRPTKLKEGPSTAVTEGNPPVAATAAAIAAAASDLDLPSNDAHVIALALALGAGEGKGKGREKGKRKGTARRKGRGEEQEQGEENGKETTPPPPPLQPNTRRTSRRKRASASAVVMRDPEKTSPILPSSLGGLDPSPPSNNTRQPHAHHNHSLHHHYHHSHPHDSHHSYYTHSHPHEESLHGTAPDIAAILLSKRLEQSPHLRPVAQEYGAAHDSHAASHANIPPNSRDRGKLQRPQSLRKSANEATMVRRKSSKKRPHDSVREDEIRAMSVPLSHKRRAGNSGSMLRRDSKKVKGGANRYFETPTPIIPLPLEESIRSSMSGNSETRAWRVSALDLFSPRPTVRCSVGSQHSFAPVGPSPTSDKSKRDGRKDRRLITGGEGNDERRSNRIDDLADTLDAGALREILDRDKRRRDRKRKQEEERLRRRLEKRVEKQREAEQPLLQTPPRQESDGRVGLGIEGDPCTRMEGIRPTTPPLHRLQTSALTPSYHEHSQLPTPAETPTVADAQAVRYSRASVPSPSPTPQTHTRVSSNVSQMPQLLSEMMAQETPAQSLEYTHDSNASDTLHAVETMDTGAPPSRKGSLSLRGWARRRSSEGRRMGVFAALFRRGKRKSRDQGRSSPSEASFSNTSRESVPRQQLPAPLVAPTVSAAAAAPVAASQPVHIIRRPSSVPRRTMSKFREDLPEFPLSPPDSRVESPELAATATSVIAARRRSQPSSEVPVGAESPATGGRTDSPVSPGVPPTNIMSQSLASVDSEGSWLSGKPIQRRSNRSHLRSSVGSSSAFKRPEESNHSFEELGMPDDEYFRRLTPQPDERHQSTQSADVLARKASSTAMAAVDDGDELDHDHQEAGTSRDGPNGTIAERPSQEEERLQGGVARQPTIIHRQGRVQSTEALLSYIHADSTDRPWPAENSAATEAAAAEPDSPTSDAGSVLLQRARSVDLGKHHSRQLSAGSAKLLSISAKRSSTDPKQSSLDSPNGLSQE